MYLMMFSLHKATRLAFNYASVMLLTPACTLQTSCRPSIALIALVACARVHDAQTGCRRYAWCVAKQDRSGLIVRFRIRGHPVVIGAIVKTKGTGRGKGG